MNFEELKVIWDAENKEHLFTLDEAALHAVVRHRNAEVHRRAARCQVAEIVGGLVFGLVMFVLASVLALGDPQWLASLNWIRVPVAAWHSAVLALSGVSMFYYAAQMYGARRRQLRREENFAASLHGDLDRALAHTNFQIQVARSILWWGLTTQWVATAAFGIVVFHLAGFSTKNFLPLTAVVLALVGLFAVVVTCQRRAISRRYEPRRRELESLRAKLADPQH